jgi:hypothetical protein
MKKPQLISVLMMVMSLIGCATTNNLRVSPSFNRTFHHINTIAVLPPDIKVYKLTAGGVRELIDEWNEESKSLVWQALEKHLGQRYGFNIKFIQEGQLESNCKALWISTKALYNVVSINALVHGYPGPNAFASKLENFDFTLGPEVNDIAKVCGADALLFVSGYDHEATGGRIALSCWNYFVGALTGITTILRNPSFMSVALVDAQTGDLLCFNTSPLSSEYSFRNKRDMDTLVEWLTRDLLLKK